MTREQKVTGEAGMKSVLSDGVGRLNQNGFWVDEMSLGGTIGMAVNERGKLAAIAPDTLDTEGLNEFNQRNIFIPPQPSIEHLPPSPYLYHTDLVLATGAGFPPFTNADSGELDTRAKALKNANVWPGMVTNFGLAPGMHPMVDLTANVKTAPFYSALLAEEIYKQKYGVRLDSNHAFDGACVWSAVICGYIVPEILTAASKFAKENGEGVKNALKELVFVVPIGTDRQKEAASFLDILAYFTGATFITVGANKNFGTPGGDAEQNLTDSIQAAALVKQGKLPRGFAYSIADGLVMQGILKKMDPAARGLKQTVILPDDSRRYGGTFLANNALPIDQINIFGYPLTAQTPTNPSFLSLLGSSKPTSLQEQMAGVAYVRLNAADLTQALNAAHILTPLDLPERLVEGTEVVILEGGGAGNVAAQTTRLLELLAGQLWARSNRTSKPTVVIASEAGIPWVDENYDASPIGNLKKSPLIRGVISARGLPAHIVSHLAALFYYPGVVNVNAGISFDREDEYVDPVEFEKLLNHYGASRKFPGF